MMRSWVNKKRIIITALMAVCIAVGISGCGAEGSSSADASATRTTMPADATRTTVPASVAATVKPGTSGNSTSSAAAESKDKGTEDAGKKGVDLSVGPALLVPKLENAYNAGNASEILHCFDPKLIKAVEGVVELLGAESGTFQRVLSIVLPHLKSFDHAAWGKIQLTALDYALDGQTGKLTYHVRLKKADGTQNDFDETVSIIQVDDVWYLALSQTELFRTGDSAIPVRKGITEADTADGLYSYCEEIDRKKLYGFMNKSGKIVIDPFFTDIGTFSEDGYCPVSKNGKWGIIDLMGNLVVDFEFGRIESEPSEGFWKVSLYNKGCGYLNLDTGKSIPCQYEDGGIFAGGVVPVKKNGYWGAVDTDGNVTVQFIYDSIHPWREPFQYTGPICFRNGRLGVGINNAWGVIDPAGNYILPMTTRESAGDRYCPEFIGDHFFVLSGNNKTILYDMDGGELLNTDMGECVGYINDTIFIQKGSHVYAFDINGNQLFDVDALSGFQDRRIDGGITGSYTDFVTSDLKMNSALLNWYDGDKYRKVDRFSIDSWNLLKVYDPMVQDRYYRNKYNLLNDLGELFFGDWYNWLILSPSRDYIAGGRNVGGSNFITDLYNRSGELIAQYDGAFSEFVGDNFLLDAKKNKIICLPTAGLEEYKKVETLKYYSTESNTSAVKVFDGVFYGLRTKDGFAGKGITYNSVSYNTENRICTMKLGAETERYRMGPDGTATKIDDRQAE